jgi:SAM-dependent methyltransferase
VNATDVDRFNAFEVSGWDRRAATYGASLGRVTSRLIDPLLDAAGVGMGTRVLDVGTGPGHLAARAVARGARAVGIDVSEAMLDVAHAAHPDLELRHGNVEELPFPDAAFDAAVGGFVLLHIGRPEQAAGELYRVLAPGGRVALTVWDEPERNRLQGVMFDAVDEAGAASPDLPAGPPMFRFAEEAELEALLADAGFVDAAVDTVSFTETVASADVLWDGLMGGSVRLPPLIEG